MDDKFKKAQQAYDNMTPPDEPDRLFEETVYPCDTCGKREIELVPCVDGFYAACCNCSNRMRFASDTADKAKENWEDAMWEAQRDQQEDRRDGI